MKLIVMHCKAIQTFHSLPVKHSNVTLDLNRLISISSNLEKLDGRFSYSAIPNLTKANWRIVSFFYPKEHTLFIGKKKNPFSWLFVRGQSPNGSKLFTSLNFTQQISCWWIFFSFFFSRWLASSTKVPRSILNARLGIVWESGVKMGNPKKARQKKKKKFQGI